MTGELSDACGTILMVNCVRCGAGLALRDYLRPGGVCGYCRQVLDVAGLCGREADGELTVIEGSTSDADSAAQVRKPRRPKLTSRRGDLDIEAARARFRRLAAEQCRAPLDFSEARLLAIDEARRRASFTSLRTRPVPWRLFRVYAGCVLAESSVDEFGHVLLVDVLMAMTGSSDVVLDSHLKDVGTRLLIARANADDPVIQPTPHHVALARDEVVFWCEYARLLDQEEMEVRVIEKATSQFSLLPGATVSVERTVQRSRKVLTGGFATIGKGTLVVTDRRTLFVGTATLEVRHEDILGITAGRELCVLNYRGVARPAVVAPERHGALVAAAVNAGWRKLALAA
jgi:hypothetical protein